MPGFNPIPLAYRAQNANGVCLLIGDQPIAFAQRVNPKIDYGAEGLYGVGSAKPQEIQQLKIGPSISLSNFALTSNGNTLIQGGQSLASILANNQFNICLVDQNESVVLTYIGAVANDYDNDTSANRPVTENVTFTALDVVDDSGQSILNGPNALSIGSAGLALSINGGLGISVTANL